MIAKIRDKYVHVEITLGGGEGVYVCGGTRSAMGWAAAPAKLQRHSAHHFQVQRRCCVIALVCIPPPSSHVIPQSPHMSSHTFRGLVAPARGITKASGPPTAPRHRSTTA